MKNSEVTASTTGRGRGQGRPWKKGQSGNPKGRPPISPDVRAAYRHASISAVEKLSELMNSTNEAVALQAAIEILNRAYGRPREAAQPIINNSETRELHEVIKAFIVKA